MPAFARPVPYVRYVIEPLKPREIDSVLAYVLALEGASQAASLAAEGKAIFHDAKRKLPRVGISLARREYSSLSGLYSFAVQPPPA
jgi:hypothetical protein